MSLELWLWIGVGYLFGSIPFGLLLTRFAGLGDIRAIGSGNIGATNVMRTGRKELAAATLALDLVKGVVPVVLARIFAPEIAAAVAVAAVVGHDFPVWLKFKGGKGVATTLGVLLALAPALAGLVALSWASVFALTRVSSLAALMAAALAPVYAWFFAPQITWLVLGLSMLLIVRHHQNIDRLLSGQEPLFRKAASE